MRPACASRACKSALLNDYANFVYNTAVHAGGREVLLAISWHPVGGYRHSSTEAHFACEKLSGAVQSVQVGKEVRVPMAPGEEAPDVDRELKAR